jgi:hypothetical protein
MHRCRSLHITSLHPVPQPTRFPRSTNPSPPQLLLSLTQQLSAYHHHHHHDDRQLRLRQEPLPNPTQPCFYLYHLHDPTVTQPPIPHLPRAFVSQRRAKCFSNQGGNSAVHIRCTYVHSKQALVTNWSRAWGEHELRWQARASGGRGQGRLWRASGG